MCRNIHKQKQWIKFQPTVSPFLALNNLVAPGGYIGLDCMYQKSCVRFDKSFATQTCKQKLSESTF